MGGWLGAVWLKQVRVDVLSNYDLRVLLKAEEGNTTTEEAYLIRSIGDLEAELQDAALVGTNNLPHDEDGVSGWAFVSDKSKGTIVIV